MNRFWRPFFCCWIFGYLIKKTPASPVQIVLLSFSIQTAFGIVFFTKQLVCVSLEKKRNQYEQVLVGVSIGKKGKISPNRIWLPFSKSFNFWLFGKLGKIDKTNEYWTNNKTNSSILIFSATTGRILTIL